MTATCPHCQRPAHDGLLCHACMRQARSDLANLPWLYLEVRRTAVGLARLTESGPGRSAEKPLPVNLHASKVADRIRASLVGWIRATQQAAGPWPRDRITHMCSHLHARLPHLRQHEAIDEMCTDLQRLVGQAARAINRPVQTRIKVGPCPLVDDDHTPCQGTVWAVLPIDHDVPAHAACDWCCDPDADPTVGLWVPGKSDTAPAWTTLGRQMQQAQARAAQAQQLAREVSR